MTQQLVLNQLHHREILRLHVEALKGRNLLYNLNEVAALEGLSMKPENFTMLQLVQNQLLRHWADNP